MFAGLKWLFLVACAVVLTGGCTAPSPSFAYPPAFPPLMRAKDQPLTAKSVAVEKFQDFRGKCNDLDPIYIYLIPLCPFGYFEYDRPENGEWFMSIEKFNFDPATDLARAATVSMEKSNLFGRVIPCGDKEAANADYILKGAVLSTFYRGRAFSYGLSCEGAWLWMLGAPAGTSLNRLGFMLWLVDRHTGKTVWTYGFEQEEYLTQWLYFRYGSDVSMFSRLMAEGMNGAVMEMEKFLSIPPGGK